MAENNKPELKLLLTFTKILSIRVSDKWVPSNLFIEATRVASRIEGTK